MVFKIGDLIKVKPENLPLMSGTFGLLLEKNAVYVVRGIDPLGHILLDVPGDPSPEEPWCAGNFKLVPKEHYINEFINKLSHGL